MAEMTTGMRDVTLGVPDVSCEHCVHAIGKALGGLAGVSEAQTDLDHKTVHVRFDPQAVTLDRITAALDDAGYPVSATTEG